MAVIGIDDYDVTGLAALHSAVRTHLHPVGDDDEALQGRVPVVVVGADPVDVLASLEAARFTPVLVVELSVHVAARGGVHGSRRKGGKDLACRREWRLPTRRAGVIWASYVCSGRSCRLAFQLRRHPRDHAGRRYLSGRKSSPLSQDVVVEIQ